MKTNSSKLLIMKYLLFILTGFAFISCNDDEMVQTRKFSECSDISENYQDYDYEEIGCQFFYTLTEYEGNQYIELGSYCADLSRSFVYNSDCVDICATSSNDPDSVCGKYLQGKETIEILFIEK